MEYYGEIFNTMQIWGFTAFFGGLVILLLLGVVIWGGLAMMLCAIWKIVLEHLNDFFHSWNFNGENSPKKRRKRDR